MKLEVAGLTRIVGERTLFRDIAFSLESGERLVITGPSGAGKTLLLRTLAWLVPADAGRITLGGRDPSQWGVPSWRAQVCYVAQRPAALLGTPRQHAVHVAALSAQQGRETDDPVALASTWSLPVSAWDQSWSTLSGGEQQRAALAIAIAHRPAVLLLDEPTSALDTDAIEAVEKTLMQLTAIWVTHDRAQAARVDGRLLNLSVSTPPHEEKSERQIP